MTLIYIYFGLLISLTSSPCNKQVSSQRIEIIQPSIEQEATSIWQTINNLSFFEQQGYTIHLPKDPLIDSLIAKSKKGTFGNDDFSTIYSLLENKLFDLKNYEKAITKISLQLDSITYYVNKIDSLKKGWDWEFISFKSYKLNITLYGTGGGYDPDEGLINLFTDPDGNFVKYKNPSYTIIHEITHIGMEYSIIHKHNVSHGLKERLVDLFVKNIFRHELPHYKIQNMGDIRIDKHLNHADDFFFLNEIMAEFVK